MQFARERIEELNTKYGNDSSGTVEEIDTTSARKEGRFFLFHRPRRWNARERLWMGYERKRGKLADLNALLRGAGEDSFSLIVGDRSILPRVKYVITLDTDTQLPRDSARQFVGTMAHPLNQPRLDTACADGGGGIVRKAMEFCSHG